MAATSAPFQGIRRSQPSRSGSASPRTQCPWQWRGTKSRCGRLDVGRTQTGPHRRGRVVLALTHALSNLSEIPDGLDGARLLFSGRQRKTPSRGWGFWIKTLAMTYSRMLDAHYHRRVRVSLPSSVWDRVVPRSYCHQGEGGGSQASMHRYPM